MTDLALDKMTTEEKLVALERIWDDLVRNPSDVPFPAWHEDVLRARADRVAEGKAEYLDWSDAKQHIIDKTK